MAALFGLLRKKVPERAKSKQLMVNGKLFDEDYLYYCTQQDRTLQQLEANLHLTDDPEEIAIGTLKTACDFYDGDWAGILSVDMDLGLWTPIWWYKVGRPDHTQTLLHEFESMESMPSWIRAMNENNIVILPDTSAVKDSLPCEYDLPAVTGKFRAGRTVQAKPGRFSGYSESKAIYKSAGYAGFPCLRSASCHGAKENHGQC